MLKDKKLLKLIKSIHTILFTIIQVTAFASNYKTCGNVDFENAKNWLVFQKDRYVAAQQPPTVNDDIIFISENDIATITSAITIDQIVVDKGGILINAIESNTPFTLNDGNDDDLILKSGAKYIIDSKCKAPMPIGNGTIRVDSLATIEINAKSGACYYACDSIKANDINFANRITWNNNSIFCWNVNSAILSAGYTYFPNVSENVIPIFKVINKSLQNGANSKTIINGLLEIESDAKMSWHNKGEKIIRNGVINNGIFECSNNCENFNFGDKSCKIGGTGSFIFANSKIKLGTNQSNIKIENNIDFNGANITIAENSNVDFGENYISNIETLKIGNNTNFQISNESGFDNCILNCENLENTASLSIEFYGNSKNFGNNIPSKFKSLTINTLDELSLNKNIEIENLNLENGKIKLANNIELYIKNDVNAQSESYVIGKIKRKTRVGEPLIFPVGTNEFPYFANIEISEMNGLESITMSFVDSVITTDFEEDFWENSEDFQQFINIGFWRLQPNSNYQSVNYDLQLRIPQTSFQTNADENYMLVKRLNPEYLWGSGSQGYKGETTIDENFICVKNKQIEGFSDAAIAIYNPTALPIELISVDAIRQGNSILINWITASEYNSDYFEIHKSYDCQRFTKIGTIKATNNSSTKRQYSFCDSEPNNKTTYYKIKMVDLDESFKWSQIFGTSTIEKNFGIENKKIIIYDARAKTKFKLYSPIGQRLISEENQSTIELEQIPNGIYFGEFEINNQKNIIKFIINGNNILYNE